MSDPHTEPEPEVASTPISRLSWLALGWAALAPTATLVIGDRSVPSFELFRDDLFSLATTIVTALLVLVALALVYVVGLMLALVAYLREPKSARWSRRIAAIAGVVLALQVAVPLAIDELQGGATTPAAFTDATITARTRQLVSQAAAAIDACFVRGGTRESCSQPANLGAVGSSVRSCLQASLVCVTVRARDGYTVTGHIDGRAAFVLERSLQGTRGYCFGGVEGCHDGRWVP